MEETRLGEIKFMAENKASMLSNLDEVKANAEKHIFCVKSELENHLNAQKVQLLFSTFYVWRPCCFRFSTFC